MGDCGSIMSWKNAYWKVQSCHQELEFPSHSQAIAINKNEHNVHVFLFFTFSVHIVSPLTETIAALHSQMDILSCQSECIVGQLVDKLNFCFKIYIQFVWARRTTLSAQAQGHNLTVRMVF